MMSNSTGEAHDVASVWAVLESDLGAEPEVRLAPTGAHSAAGDIVAGVDHLGNRHLLVPLLPGEPFVSDVTGKSIHLVRLNQAGVSYASAVCLSRELDETFTQFCRELIADLAVSPAPAADARLALDNWKRLFSSGVTAGVLSEEAQLGLYGELILLKVFVENDPLRRTACWKGPDHSQHDFRWNALAVEAKTTRSREGRRVTISSLEQLNPPPGASLYLAHLRLEDDPGSESLAELVDSIVAVTSEPLAFRNQLSRIGYDAIHAETYNLLRCRLVETRIYDVEADSFPRIIPSSFSSGHAPSGVLGLNYQIDITNDPPTPLSEEHAKELLHRIAAMS